MSKKYNPFKMWGAWVGAGIGLIIAISLIMNFFVSAPIVVYSNPYAFVMAQLYDNCAYGVDSSGNLYSGVCDKYLISRNITTLIISEIFFKMLAGFLIGWGIHSLIRGLRK
ncbi:MAG: hypothetical protein KKF56_05400 [Nanoarchaeota archaeon]|nr:hypothetical protein [Nanoarchaeota archaeon]